MGAAHGGQGGGAEGAPRGAAGPGKGRREEEQGGGVEEEEEAPPRQLWGWSPVVVWWERVEATVVPGVQEMARGASGEEHLVLTTPEVQLLFPLS